MFCHFCSTNFSKRRKYFLSFFGWLMKSKLLINHLKKRGIPVSNCFCGFPFKVYWRIVTLWPDQRSTVVSLCFWLVICLKLSKSVLYLIGHSCTRLYFAYKLVIVQNTVLSQSWYFRKSLRPSVYGLINF